MKFWLIYSVVVGVGFLCIRSKKMFNLYLLAIAVVGGFSLINEVTDLIYNVSRMSVR